MTELILSRHILLENIGASLSRIPVHMSKEEDGMV